MHSEIIWPAWLIGGVLTVIFYPLMLRAGRRYRFLADTPTSKAKGVFIGQVELAGKTRIQEPRHSWLAGAECVWYRYSIKEEWERWETETYTDKEGKTQTRQVKKSGWTEIASGGESPAFYLEDETGRIQIRPDGAEIEPEVVFSETATWGDALYTAKTDARPIADSTGRRQFSESAILLGREVFVAGRARERTDAVAPEIAQDEAQELFLISCRGEAKVQRKYRLQFWSFGALSMIGLPGASAAQTGSADGVVAWPLALGLLGGVAALWLVGWLWMAFNSLVFLRNRTAQAWSLVDVQLKRRADLLPRLVQVILGLRDHENTVQREVASLRAQASATPAGQPGPDLEKVAPTIIAVAEAYPELKSDQAFARLQRELSETETRIALARDYYNSMATHLNTRLEIIPDRWFAPLAGLRPQALLVADSFEREPVTVRF
jgi:hypothetical protein